MTVRRVGYLVTILAVKGLLQVGQKRTVSVGPRSDMLERQIGSEGVLSVKIAGIVKWAAGCYLKSAGSPAGTTSMLKIGPFTQ
jgi:hypothetical protein